MRCRRMRPRTKCKDVYASLVSQRSPTLIQSSGTPQASQVSPSLTVDRLIGAHFPSASRPFLPHSPSFEFPFLACSKRQKYLLSPLSLFSLHYRYPSTLPTEGR
jgi:hypothetical protein